MHTLLFCLTVTITLALENYECHILFGVASVKKYINGSFKLPCEYGNHPEVGTVAKDLLDIVVSAYREAVLISSASEHGGSERFCKF